MKKEQKLIIPILTIALLIIAAIIIIWPSIYEQQCKSRANNFIVATALTPTYKEKEKRSYTSLGDGGA